MDIVLKRILSLIPQKDGGGFVHGAKKTFAQSIGYKGGEIISDWIAGRSDTYKNKVYEISEKYNVSVEWLLGNTDDPGQKEKPAETGELDAQFGTMWRDFSEDKKKATIEFMKLLGK